MCASPLLESLPDPSNINEILPPKTLYTFLVGAGISMNPPSNIPSARQFVSSLLHYYAPPEEIDNILQIENLRYEFLVELIQNIFDPDLHFLDYLAEVKEPNAIHYFLGSMIMRYHQVITTNFDPLIEVAYQRICQRLIQFPRFHEKQKAIITRSDFKYFSLDSFPVIKIHGSKSNVYTGQTTIESLVTTITALGKNRESGQTFAMEPFKQKVVDQITNGRSLIVMGYSGSDDFDISPLLKEMKTIQSLIWVEHQQEMGKDEVNLFKIESDSTSPQASTSKTDRLLWEIASNLHIPVYKIVANTISLIEGSFRRIFQPDTFVDELLGPANTLTFDNWMKQQQISASQGDQCKLAFTLYRDLGLTEHAERVARQALEQAVQAHDQHLQFYFNNGLGLVFNTHSQHQHALNYFELSLKISTKDPSLVKNDDIIALYFNIAQTHRHLGNISQYRDFLGKAHNLTTSESRAPIKIAILSGLGAVQRDLGNFDQATTYFTQAMQIAERSGNLMEKGDILNKISIIELTKGYLQKALDHANEGYQISLQLGDLDTQISTLNTIGNVYRAAGQFDLALKHLDRALPIASQLKNLENQALIMNSQGILYLNLRKIDLALKLFNDSLKICEQLGDISGQATRLNNIGAIFRDKGLFDQALDAFNRSIELSEQLSEYKHLGVRISNRGSIYELTNRKDEALAEYQKALAIHRKTGNDSGIAGEFVNIGYILGDMGRHDECIVHYKQALQIYERLDVKPALANTLNNLGTALYKFKRDFGQSIRYLKQAEQIYKDLGLTRQLRSTTLNLSHIRNAMAKEP